ncbi:MAG: HepT-like ribonuclease domain-containing protein, partial [Endomicrobiales bacterium]
MKKRNYSDYLQDIVDSCSDVQEFIKGISYDDFVKDKKTKSATIRAIEVIGEAVKNIPAVFRSKHPGIPWKQIAGMRDKLIHEYFGVDTKVLWKTAKEDVPIIKDGFK